MSLSKYLRLVERTDPIRRSGRVTQMIGLIVEATGPLTAVGEVCEVTPLSGPPVPCEVVGFREDRVLLMPLGEMAGIAPGATVLSTGGGYRVGVGPELLGRVVDALGRPMDGRGPIVPSEEYPIERQPFDPMKRLRIREVLATGIRAIDSMLTVGKGQRIGIFSGSGIGKSVLLGMIARNTSADVNVIGLIGERGREVREFIERDLGAEGLARSVVVVATSDSPALLRRAGALTTHAIAEYFRDQGRDVMLMMDSVTRFAMAQREIGLAVGEPSATKGYTPSVFSLLPRLLERSGTTDHTGSITGLYTVLVEADDMTEPIADSVRAILDGHVVLRRELAARGHYPPIDVLHSISRLMIDIVPDRHRLAAQRAKQILATYADAEDLIHIGAYVRGSNPEIDLAIERKPHLDAYLRQDIYERQTYDDALDRFHRTVPEVS